LDLAKRRRAPIPITRQRAKKRPILTVLQRSTREGSAFVGCGTAVAPG
jgi:hypothetical protein